MKPKAYSYTRLSSKKQTTGVGRDRQNDYFQDFIDAHPEFEPDSELSLVETRSSFRGGNFDRIKGVLGKFIKKCEDGEVAPGSHLVMEDMDRFSRAEVGRVMNWITTLVYEHSITIVFLKPEEKFVTQEFLSDPYALIITIMESSRAHGESVVKSRRTKKNWKKAREKARSENKIMTTKCPAWLEVCKATNKFVERRPKADAVRKIFELSAEGVGTVRIAQIMNESHPPISDHKIKPGQSRRWNKSYISKILKDRSVLGEFQPKIMNYETGIRQPEGEPIIGYYPRIISDDLFYRSLQKMALNRKTRSESNSDFINLLKGLVVNADDNSTMQIATSRVTRKNGDVYLQRRLHSYEYTRTKNGCPWSIDYWMLEDLVLHSLVEINIDDFTRVDQTRSEIKQLEQKISGIKEAISEYDKQFRNPKYRTMFDQILSAKVRLEDELIQENARYEQLISKAALSKPKAEMDIQMLKGLLGKEAISTSKKQRIDLVEVLPNLIAKILVVPVKFKNRQVGAIGSVLLHNEKVRNFVLAKQPGVARAMISTTDKGAIDIISTPNGLISFLDAENVDGWTGGKVVMKNIRGAKAKKLKKPKKIRDAENIRQKFLDGQFFGKFGVGHMFTNLFELDKQNDLDKN